MSTKAVYASKVLAIYISGIDLSKILFDPISGIPVMIGKWPVPLGFAELRLTAHAKSAINTAIQAEIETLKQTRLQFAADHPGYTNKKTRRHK